jgi:hypothetical protein
VRAPVTVKSVDNGRSGAPIGCRIDAWQVSTFTTSRGRQISDTILNYISWIFF